MTAADPFGLERFITAQAPVFPTVLAELKAARKLWIGGAVARWTRRSEMPHDHRSRF